MFWRQPAKQLLVTLGLIVGVLWLWHGGAAFAAVESRIALVIGNSGYKIAPPLLNPANDARLMAETLRGLGFEVIERIDADRETMLLATFELQDRLIAAGKDSVGLFFYAGHGVQAGGENYFIPLKTEIKKEREISVKAISASSVLKQMEFSGNRMNFVILDACRNNPFPASTRAATRGLARMNAPTGSLVAYSTGPGEVAADGDGDNSPYVLALSEALQIPGVPAELMFKRVRERVLNATNDEQTPWEESSLKGADFYFNTDVPEEPAAPAISDTAAATQRETAFWESIEDGSDPVMFEAFLKQYPAGTFAPLARTRIKQFEAAQTAAVMRRQAEAEAEARRLAAEEEARQQAEIQRLSAAVEAERLAEAEALRRDIEALRLVAEEEERRQAEAQRLAAEEEARRLVEAEVLRLTAEEEAQRMEVEYNALKETQLALLSVPPVLSIVVDKAEVENDDRLKTVIRKHFKGLGFRLYSTYKLEIAYFHDLSVKSISGATFIVDIEYEQMSGPWISYGNATVNIEKTADSYKIISFDRIKNFDFDSKK